MRALFNACLCVVYCVILYGMSCVLPMCVCDLLFKKCSRVLFLRYCVMVYAVFDLCVLFCALFK